MCCLDTRSSRDMKIKHVCLLHPSYCLRLLTFCLPVVPYTGLFGPSAPSSPHIVIHGTIIRLDRDRVTYTPTAYESNKSEQVEKTLEFEYAVYALGAQLPAPIDLWGTANIFDEPKSVAESVDLDSVKQQLDTGEVGTKRAGIEWLHKAQKRLGRVRSVLVVGGGALGIRMFSLSISFAIVGLT